nr:MAG TPA: hypothetical protein [Caudoviricetes sp.]
MHIIKIKDNEEQSKSKLYSGIIRIFSTIPSII